MTTGTGQAKCKKCGHNCHCNWDQCDCGCDICHCGTTKSKEEIRESYRNILGETAASFNTSQFNGPLKVSGTDTTSANGSLPEGNVSMDQIMGLMNSKG